MREYINWILMVIVSLIINFCLLLCLLFWPSGSEKNTKEDLCIETTALKETTNSTELIKNVEAIESTKTNEVAEVIDATLGEAKTEESETDKSLDNSFEDIIEEVYPEEVQWYSSYRVTSLNTKTTSICGEEIDRDFLAKLLYREGGAMNWWGQVYTCSAILNLCEVLNRTLSDCGRDVNCFAAAPYIDSATPTQMCYDVVDYVLGGGRIADIAYFRTGYYHNFGTPVCYVDGHYFSKQ